VIPDSEPSSLSDESSWFFDWLQEMRFEAKEKNLLCTLSYAVFSVTELEQENIIGKVSLFNQSILFLIINKMSMNTKCLFSWATHSLNA
jgi:hypothetical protein